MCGCGVCVCVVVVCGFLDSYCCVCVCVFVVCQCACASVCFVWLAFVGDCVCDCVCVCVCGSVGLFAFVPEFLSCNVLVLFWVPFFSFSKQNQHRCDLFCGDASAVHAIWMPSLRITGSPPSAAA